MSGKAGGGKNTAAEIIIKDILKLNDNEFYLAAFADPIKEIIQKMFPSCDPESLYGDSKLRQNRIASDLDEFSNKSIGTSFRQASIDIGKLGRSYDNNFWVWHAQNKFNKMKETNIKAYLISDQRFPEELRWLKSEGFTLCRIKREDNSNINDISEYVQDQLSDDQFDIVINNNYSLDNLKKQLQQALDKQFHNNMTYLQVRNAV